MHAVFKFAIVPSGLISQKIFLARGIRTMLDADPARLYGVATKNLNKAVKRNANRFPSDFMFPLSSNDLENLRFQIGTSKKKARRPPLRSLRFHGTRHCHAAACASQSRAVQVNVAVIENFRPDPRDVGNSRTVAP
jgi:hypothetical protein